MKDERVKRDVRTGALFLMLSALSFATMGVFIRLSGDLPTLQKAFFRNLIALVAASIVLIKTRPKFGIKKESRLPLFLRCFAGTIGMWLNFWTIDRLGIADASMLQKMSPFFIILLGIFILKEKAGVAEYLLIFFAIIGVSFVIKPTAGLASLPALIGLIGGLFTALAYIYVRKLGTMGIKKEVIVFSFSLFSTLISLPYILFFYQAMSMRQLIYLIAAGCFAAIAQFSMTYAYSKAPAKDISIFDYVQIIFAAIYGSLIFSEAPDSYSLIGYAIIIGAAFVKWRLGKAEE